MHNRGKGSRMRTYVCALATLLLTVALANADFTVPQQTIVGAEEAIPAGDIVLLAPSTMKTVPPFLVNTTYDWTVVEQDLRGWKPGQPYPYLKEKPRIRQENDGSVVFGAGLYQNKYLVICSCTYSYKDDKGNTGVKTQRLSAEVTVAGEPFPAPTPPPPPPPPTPPTPPTPPAPDPVFPASTFNLEGKAYSLAKSKVTVSADKKAAVCTAVAQSFDGIASAINAGTLTDAEDILKKTKVANNSALQQAGADLTAFDAFGVGLQKELYSLYQAQKLNVAADYAEAWKEISVGLKAIK